MTNDTYPKDGDSVVIEVRGGVAECIAKPSHIEVVIIDWDNADENGEPSADSYPAEHSRYSWIHDGELASEAQESSCHANRR